MSSSLPENAADLSMLELFRVESETQCAALSSGLVELERSAGSPAQLEALMRAAHSLKGAARIVGLEPAVQVAHAMEDVFSAAQQGRFILKPEHIDQLLAGTDLLARIGRAQECAPESVEKWVEGLKRMLRPEGRSGFQPDPDRHDARPALPQAAAADASPDRFLRVTAEHLNRLLGLTGEALVESRRLKPVVDSLLRLKRLQSETARQLETIREALASTPETAVVALAAAQTRLAECQCALVERLAEMETMDRRSTNLSLRLHHEALACRMRPFADGLPGFSRMVRDVARTLGKQVRLDIVGESTRVDRDVLQQLEAPLTHLLRNALDHGIETPEQRQHAGKPETATLRVEARHGAGRLLITVSDDGAGIDVERVRDAVLRRRLVAPETATLLSKAELLEFLFLPGFTMREEVSELSGRGVGLDIVQTMARSVRGNARVHTEPGRGTRFELELPLALSVLRALLVEVAGEPLALPLAQLQRTLKVAPESIRTLEGRECFESDGRQIGLVSAHQILERNEPPQREGARAVVVLGAGESLFGLAVDRVLGERELVVQPLDHRLGKVKNISAGALLEDGSPVLIADIDDLIVSIEKLLSSGPLRAIRPRVPATARQAKRILVVDDSLTVRELERKLLTARGYEVEVAVDGIDGWNAARSGRFQLIISDVDMPRMDGIELVTQLKRDPRLKTVPMMIVSYKDRDEDRRRGLEAGADFYLTKGSFHDHRLIEAVVDLIGEADA